MSTTPRITVHQGLAVTGIEVNGLTVRVLLAGGCAGWSGTVAYDFDCDAAVQGWLTRVRDWRDEGHPVTVVERSGIASIVDERALFEAALGPTE